MYQFSGSTQAALDYNSTIIGALELSEKKWVCPQFNCLELAGIRATCTGSMRGRVGFFCRASKGQVRGAAGRKIARVILTHEVGAMVNLAGVVFSCPTRHRGPRDPAIEPTVDRRVHDGQRQISSMSMLLRTLMAWLRGEPRVCSCRSRAKPTRKRGVRIENGRI